MPLTENTVVWASAGTGKTRRIVEAYVDFLAAGFEPLRLVAMTFTEKAAGEMRDRVRGEIYRRMQADPAAHKMWMRVLSLLPAAPIATIHRFCGSLLRTHGLEAGIDPSFNILDEQGSLDLAREAAVDATRNEIRSGSEDVERLFGDFGLESLTEIVIGAGYWINSLGQDPAWLQRQADRQVEAAAGVADTVAEYLSKFGGNFESIGLHADEQDARKARHPLKKRDDPAAPLPRIGQIAGAGVARQLSRLVALSVARFQAKKRSANAMDFDDLLLEARNLLRDSRRIRRHYQDHFRAVLVDEFQDTDEVQAEIIRLLTGDPADESRYARGKLLIVGDPKQSIYRFRRARVTVFVRMMQEIRDQGGVLETLKENFRSAGPLVEFSNRLSESMLDGKGKRELSGTDLSYRIRFSDADLLEPRSPRTFEGITYLASEEGTHAAEGRAMEAEAIARLLGLWKSSGVIESWREVAILMRAMTNASVYVGALVSHGIPVYVVQGTAFYQKPEVSDLIALLELVLHPGDPAARTAVLTSGLGGLTFNDLLAGKTSPALEDILAPWIENRDRATAAEILVDVIHRTNYDAVLMAQKNGEQQLANVGKLIEITRNLARQGVSGLDDVVRYLRGRALDAKVREPEAQIVGQDEDVVRLLTVHQAKGLEFDAVIIPDLAARSRSNSGDRAIFSDNWGILAGAAYGLHRKPLPHSLILQARQEEDDQQFEEEKRLLYVAVTRARRMLVLGEGFADRTGLWLKWVRDLMDTLHPGGVDKARSGKPSKVRVRSRGQDFTIQLLSAAEYARPEQLSLKIDLAASGREAAAREFRDTLRRLEQPVARAASGIEMTPSDLLTLDSCFRYFHWTRLQGIADPSRPLRVDTPQMRAGSAAHKIMESGIIPSAEALEEAGLEELQAVFGSDEWKSLAQDDLDRELPFIVHLRVDGRECFVRGRMDAVAPGTPPRVIDYKFASWRPGREAAYEIQMMAYALALMKSTGSAAAAAELWYLKAPLKVIRREYALAEVQRRIEDLIHRYLGALQSGVWPSAARSYCDAVECGFRDRCWTGRPAPIETGISHAGQ